MSSLLPVYCLQSALSCLKAFRSAGWRQLYSSLHRTCNRTNRNLIVDFNAWFICQCQSAHRFTDLVNCALV